MSTGNNTIEEELEEGGETFHIYILSFSYGFLLLVILGHLIVRWQWRRVKESRPPQHYPGDKSFKCKAIRDELIADFAAIKRLTPDPLLITPNRDPKIYGPCKEGEALPSHWYRLKTCEAANKFVLANRKLLRSADDGSPNPAIPAFISPSQRYVMILALPEFVTKLRQEGVLYVVGQEREERVARLCELYVMARTQDGGFPGSKFQEFTERLQQLQDMLPATVSRTLATSFEEKIQERSSKPALQQMDSVASEHGGLMREFSMEPLIASSPPAVIPSGPPRPPPGHHKHSSRPHKYRELSPLIMVDPPSSCPDVSYMMPETPL